MLLLPFVVAVGVLPLALLLLLLLPTELGVPGRGSLDDRSLGCARSFRELLAVPPDRVGVVAVVEVGTFVRDAVVALLLLPGESLILTTVVRTPALATLDAAIDAALTASE